MPIQRIQIFGNPDEMGTDAEVEAELDALEAEIAEMEQIEADIAEVEEINATGVYPGSGKTKRKPRNKKVSFAKK